MKIAVIGYSGGGKSTLARKLGDMYGEEVLHLDTLHFSSGWIERDSAAVREEVRTFTEKPGWVIDGNYASYLQE